MIDSNEKHKISRKLILYIILFSSMITAIITVIQLAHEYTEDKSELDTNMQNINTGYREGITNAVWLDDKVQLLSILDGVVALPDIEYIEVKVNDKTYAARGRKVKTHVVSGSFALQRLYDNKLLTIGETYIEAELTAIYRRLLNHAWAILGLNAIKTFIVALFMYFIFNRLVVRRLEKLSAFVNQYNLQEPGNSGNIQLLPDEKYNDEITGISRSLNTMHEHLSQSIKELLGLKKTLDLALDGVVMFRPQTFEIFYANTGASRMLGYSIDELMELTPMDICADLTREILSKLSSPSIESEHQSLDIMTHFQTRQGNLIPVRLVLQYLHPDYAEPRFVFTARDITDRINTQMEIQTLLDEAKAANAELEAFSYSISHDLRTPLRSIDGFSLLLAQEYTELIDDEGKDYINRVRKSAQHMGLLIDDILALARVTRGELNRREYNISEMAWDSIKKLQDVEPSRKVNVIISPEIIGQVDKSLFQNLLDNLLGNAWKYTSKTRNPEIEFSCFKQGEETIYFVRDNGAGFDMQYASKLFNAFQRLHGEEDFTGTGIGLATVSRILQRHGGRIWAEAEINKGATFYFTVENENPLSLRNSSEEQTASGVRY